MLLLVNLGFWNCHLLLLYVFSVLFPSSPQFLPSSIPPLLNPSRLQPLPSATPPLCKERASRAFVFLERGNSRRDIHRGHDTLVHAPYDWSSAALHDDHCHGRSDELSYSAFGRRRKLPMEPPARMVRAVVPSWAAVRSNPRGTRVRTELRTKACTAFLGAMPRGGAASPTRVFPLSNTYWFPDITKSF